MPVGGLNDWIETQRSRPPAPTRWWYATLALGLATLFFSLHLGQVFPAEGAAVRPGYGSPVIAFEFARGEADLFAVFGPESDPAQVGRLAAMRTGNEQDYLFMLLYAGFLGSGCLALWRETRSRLLLAATPLPLLAALCDAYENWLLFDIQAAFTLGDYSPAMASLPYPVAAKFLLLAATNVAIGWALTLIGGWWRLAGTLVIIPCFATVMAVIAPAAFGWTLVAVAAAGWLALLVTATFASGLALVKRRPLVDFEPDMPERPAPERDEREISLAPGRLRRFGRRRSDDER